MEINPTLTAEEFGAITDEDVKALYKQKDDSFILDVKGVLSAKDATKRKYEAEKAERERLANEFSALEQFKGLNIDEVKEALATKQKAEEKKLIEKGEFERIRLKDKEDFDKKFSDALTAKEAETKRLAGALEKSVTRQEVMAELVKQGVLRDGTATQDAVELFMPNVKTEIADDLTVKHKIIDATGYDTGKTLEEAIADFRTAKPYLFTNNGAGGTPQTPISPSGGNGATTTKRSTMTTNEKTAFIKKYGHAKYLQLPQ